jgi:hypothetical protein
MAVVLHSSCRRQNCLVPLLVVLLVGCWVLASSPIAAAARPIDDQQAAAACLDCIARTGCQYCLAESIDLYNEGGDYCECDEDDEDDDAADQAMAEEDGYYNDTTEKGSSCLVTREECEIMDHHGAILHFFEVLFLFLWFSVVLQCLCACACIGGCVYCLSGGGGDCCSLVGAASGSSTTSVVSNNHYYRAQEGGYTTTTTTQYAVLVGTAKSLSYPVVREQSR